MLQRLSDELQLCTLLIIVVIMEPRLFMVFFGLMRTAVDSRMVPIAFKPAALIVSPDSSNIVSQNIFAELNRIRTD